MADVNIQRENLKWPFTSTGALFSIVFAVSSLAIIPACGRGTGLLIILAFGPYGVGLFFWPTVAFLLADLRSSRTKGWVAIVLAAHYIVLCIYLVAGGSEERQRTMETFRTYPQYMLPPAILYLVAHALIWVIFIRGVLFYGNAPSNNTLDRSGDSAFLK